MIFNNNKHRRFYVQYTEPDEVPILDQLQNNSNLVKKWIDE
jgi:hypothetical protein